MSFINLMLMLKYTNTYEGYAMIHTFTCIFYLLNIYFINIIILCVLIDNFIMFQHCI